jgi:HK97 family phage major capsid protein
MSMKLFELKTQREAALNKATALVQSAESTGRSMTAAENLDYSIAMSAVDALNPQIKKIEASNTLLKMVDGNGFIIPGNGNGGAAIKRRTPEPLTAEYFDGFHRWLSSGGQDVSAAMYEGGGGPSGGYVVPIVVDDQIVPLAPLETGVRKLASVIPTKSDIKIPTKSAFGTAAAKAETSSFGGTQPTLGQFTLSAFMGGVQGDLSWELVQDAPAFQQFAITDMLDAMAMYEENLFINGTGSGQAQGLLGNVGTGVIEEPDTNGNLVSINGTLDLIGQLNALYHPGASWLMTRATSIIIRKAQVESNLFFPAFVTVNGKDYLHGYPVEYSSSMPTAARAATPVLFGDFSRGYVIGDRGGSGINVKILDQPKAAQGLITLLAYRRMDGRVRRSEAIQPYYVSAS